MGADYTRLHRLCNRNVQKNATILERLEKLKNTKDFTWEQLAEKLALSVSMLMQVKSGDRQLSPRALFRLECAEKLAGLRYSEPVAGAHEVKEAALSTDLIQEVLSDAADIKHRIEMMEFKLRKLMK